MDIVVYRAGRGVPIDAFRVLGLHLMGCDSTFVLCGLRCTCCSMPFSGPNWLFLDIEGSFCGCPCKKWR